MMKLGPNQRKKLSGIFANFSQITFGTLFVSNFFKEGNWQIRVFAIVFLIASGILSVVLEPEEI